jgi:hypothetical protein
MSVVHTGGPLRRWWAGLPDLDQGIILVMMTLGVAFTLALAVMVVRSP